jgi:hypothetical protein
MVRVKNHGIMILCRISGNMAADGQSILYAGFDGMAKIWTCMPWDESQATTDGQASAMDDWRISMASHWRHFRSMQTPGAKK